VADSLLVRCSLNGEDPYWGRVVSELGSAGVAFDLDRVEVAYGGVVVCRAGVVAEHDDRALRAHMQGRAIELSCDLGLGTGTGAVLTTDLGHGYIDENRTTS
jgi:glutamate N-acetyltransferase/amino-acid N-acetyltransferase